MNSASKFPAKIARWPHAWGAGLNRSFARVAGLRELRLRRATARQRDELEAVCASLAALPGEIETRFLACGTALHEQVKLTSQLLAQAAQLHQQGERSERGEAAVSHAGAAINANLNLSDELARKAGQLGANLESHAENLQRLLGDQQLIERSFAPMQVLHALLRIESALLPAELRSQFHSVTDEMQRLHADVAHSFAEHNEKLARTRHDALATAARLHRQATEHATLIAQKRTETQDSLARLAAELARTRERNRRLHAAITDLDRETDAITVSLQYQDITRQKLEHVQTAARDVLAGFTRSDGTPFARRLRLWQTLCQVQSVQLAAVQEELQHASTTIATGLRTMLDRLQRIEQESLSLAGLQQVAAQMDAVTVETIEAHRLGRRMVDDSLRSLTQSVGAAETFAAATTGATDTMRRLAMDIHFMGLNAQVQAVQAKNGSLEVLASAAAGISSEAGGLTLRFEQKLVEATASLAQFVQSIRIFHDHKQAEQTIQQAQHEELVRQLTEENDTGKALIAKVGTLLQQLREQADTLLRSLDLADFSREAIARARQLFDALAAECATAGQGEALADESILHEVSSRYTMSSERAAHAAALAGTGLAELPPTAPETDGFELFTEPAATATAVAVAPAESAAPAADPVAAIPAAAPAPDPALGDNVELF